MEISKAREYLPWVNCLSHEQESVRSFSLKLLGCGDENVPKMRCFIWLCFVDEKSKQGSEKYARGAGPYSCFFQAIVSILLDAMIL